MDDVEMEAMLLRSEEKMTEAQHEEFIDKLSQIAKSHSLFWDLVFYFIFLYIISCCLFHIDDV